MNGVKKMSFSFSEFVKKTENAKNVFSIGKSWLGNGLYVLLSGTGDKKLLVCGELSANDGEIAEIISDLAFADFRDVNSVFNLPKIFSAVSVYFLPFPNPDGSCLRLHGENFQNPFSERIKRFVSDGDFSGFTANARGVDIDRNFASGHRVFEKNGPSFSGYCGDYPESEKETAAISYFCRKENFDAVLVVGKDEKNCFSSTNFPDKFEKIVCGYCNIPIISPKYKDGSFLLWLKESETPTISLNLSFDGRADELFFSTVMLTAASC